MISKERFFNKYREYFGSLNQSQVNGLSYILTKLDESKVFSLENEYAYILATIFHECAATWQPIPESGGSVYLRSKPYYPYIGRGYVQLTWDFNYEKFGKILDIDLGRRPELALEPETAWKILEIGMSKGLYTGKKLSDYVNENKTDYRSARRVINGLDQSILIKGYAEKFEECIEFSQRGIAENGINITVTEKPDNEETN